LYLVVNYALQQQKISPFPEKQPDDLRSVTADNHVSCTFFPMVRIGIRPGNNFGPDADSEQSTEFYFRPGSAGLQ
jgi:hypothetical protein